MGDDLIFADPSVSTINFNNTVVNAGTTSPQRNQWERRQASVHGGVGLRPGFLTRARRPADRRSAAERADSLALRANSRQREH
jgi:hypothetical protein